MKANNLPSIIVLTLTFTFSACESAGGKSALVGTWLEVECEKCESMELLSDGTGIADENAFTWKVVDGRLYITVSVFGTQKATSFSYKVSGSELAITDNAGKVSKYKKRRL